MSKRELLLKKIIEATKPSTSGTKELEELGIADQLFNEDGSYTSRKHWNFLVSIK